MKDLEEIWEIEEGFWLKGIEAFEKNLANQCLMVFPKPSGILSRAEAIEGLKQVSRWDSLHIANKKIMIIKPNLLSLGYEAIAKRSENEYKAVCSSSYFKRGNHWLLFQHQQTPFN